MKKYRKRLILSTLVITILVLIVGIFTSDSSFSFNTISNSSELASTCTPGNATTMYVTGSNVNIRAGAGTDSSSLGTLSKCTVVTTYCKVNNFYRISNSSAKYMSADYLNTSKPSDCSSTPATTTSSPSYTIGELQKSPATFYQDITYSGTINLTNVQNVGAGEDNKISVTIHNSSGSNVSSNFNITKNYTYNDSNYRGQMTITFTKKSEVPAGSYYVLIGSHRVNFTVARKQLNFDITKNGPESVPENQDGEWRISLAGNIIPNGYTMSNFDYSIKDASGTNRADYFNITVENNQLVIKNKKRQFAFSNSKWLDSVSNYARKGTYTVNITVQNPNSFEADKVPNRTRSTTITIGEKVGTLEEEKNAQELNRYELQISQSNYNIAVKGVRFENSSKVYIIQNILNSTTEEYYEAELKDTYPNLTISDFSGFFDGLPPVTTANKSVMLINPSDTTKGYHFAYKLGNIFVYKITSSKVTYVTSSGELQEKDVTAFSTEFPTAYNAIKDTSKYGTDTDGYIRYIKSGKDKVNKQINKLPGIYPLAVTGGEYKIKLKFKDYLDDELSKFMVTLKNNDGETYISYANGGKSVKNADFDIDVDLKHMSESVIYVTIIYRSNESKYAGNYNIDYGFGKTDHNSPFTLQDGIFDYVIFSELSEEDSVDERLECVNSVCEKPMSNKKYPYYIGFYLKKSKVDVDTLDFALEQMNYKVYDQKATMTNGQLDFYKEEDYIIKIESYKDNNVTFTTSTDGGVSFTNSQTMSRTQFTSTYSDAAELIERYNYDSNGKLISDKFDLHLNKITEPTDDSNLMTVTYNGGTTAKVDDTFKHAHAELYKYIITRFVYPNGTYILGAIHGTRKIFTENNADIKGNDVSDEFFVKVNRENATDDTLDPAKAIVVLPKTEVDPGNYYVYVGYGGLDGVGYAYNYGSKDGERENDAPIDKELFPEYWQQNIHETSIYYGDPEYDVEVEDPIITNDIDDTLVAYKNATSHIEIPFVLDYIYDLQTFHYTIEYKNGSSWINADNDFDFFADLHIPDEINESNYKESVKQKSVISLTSKIGTTKEGKYRIRFTYTDGKITMKEVTKEFDVSGNYFDINFKDATDTIFYTNLGKELSFDLDCLSITNPNAIKFELLFNNTVQPNSNNSFKDYSNNTKTIFTYTTSNKSGQNDHSTVTIKLKNYLDNQAPQAQAGTYTLRASYTGTNSVTVTSEMNFSVIEPEKDIKSGQVTPKSTEKEMTIDMILISEFINYNNLKSESTTYVIKKYDSSTRGYIDVSSSDSTNRLFKTEGTWENHTGAEKESYSGNLKITLLQDRLNDIYAAYDEYTDPYYIEITVDHKTYDLELKSIKELFNWDITVQISGSVKDEKNEPYPVNGIYRNAEDVTITVNVTTPHEDKFKYLITQSCGKNSTCNPSEDYADYKDRFTEETYANNKLVLGLNETGRDDDTRLQIGDYQLVLYYNQNDYRIFDFVVHPDFVAIIFNDEISIATKLKNDRYVSELYTNKPTEIEIPVKVIGADYNDVTISITDPNQDQTYTEKFNIDKEKFTREHMLDIAYDPKDDFSAGEYMIMASKEVEENNVVSDSQNVKFLDTFYNYELTDVTYEPTPAVPNADNGGKITIKVETEDMFTGDTVANNQLKKEIIDSIKVIGNDNEDISSAFQSSYQDTSATNDFNIVMNYSNSDIIKPGEYTVKVSCVKSDTVVERTKQITFVDYDRKLVIKEVETISDANDKLVHRNMEGTYRVKFSSNYDIEPDNIQVKVLDKENVDKKDSFKIEKHIDYVDVIYTNEQQLDVGEYKIELTYVNATSQNNDVSSVDVILYGDYKEIKIANITASAQPIYADEENQYYTFELTSTNLSDDEKSKLGIRVYDKYGNIFYSTVESDETEETFEFEKAGEDGKYKIKILPYKARVDEYEVALVLAGEYNYVNESNRLKFSVDDTKFKITLMDSSNVVPQERINNTDDFYDYIGVNGTFDFTSTYIEDDVYSIKILNKNKLIQEIDVTPQNINGVKNVIFDADEISNGKVEFALCIKGLPYVSITKDVLEYIQITDLSIILDNKDIEDKEEITLRPGDTKKFTVITVPANATNQNPTFTVKNTDIATFDGSTITITGSGETTIDVYTKEIQKKIKLTVYPYIESDIYEIDNEHKTIFVNSLKSVNFLKTEFMSHLEKVSDKYTILDGKGVDVTGSTNVIGTNYKIISNNYTYTIIVIGDVTGDGRIEMGDVTFLNRIVKGREHPTDPSVIKAAHILKKDNLELGDVTKLNRFYRGHINEI